MVAGVGFKIAAVPFHMWAPDVYEGAPTPITAFLSVGSKAASFAMLLRIFVEGLPGLSVDWRILFQVLSIVTMTVGNFAALTQSNLKRMLAYSSIAHAGYLLMGVVAGTPRGVTAMLIYLLVYSFMQLGAFAIIVLLRRRDVVGDELKDFSGLHFRSPFAAFAMLLFMLSLGGIPPTAGFMGKFWLFGAAIDAGYYWLAVIGVLNSAMSLYYYIRVVVFMYIKTERTGSEPVIVAGAGLRAGGGGGRDDSCWVSIRGCCSTPRRRRRERSASPRLRPRCGEPPLRELFHKVRYTPSRLSGYAGTMARKDPKSVLERSAKALQENAEQSGPAAGASYTLIGAIVAAGRHRVRHRFVAGDVAVVPRRRLVPRGDRRALRSGAHRLASMKPVVVMVAVSVGTCLIAGLLVDARTRVEVLFGMAGPLAMAAGSWVLVERTFARHAQRLTSVMIAAFAVKMVFFGAYVVVMLKLLLLRPVPFVASFVSYFVGLYLMEALYLRRMLAGSRSALKADTTY